MTSNRGAILAAASLLTACEKEPTSKADQPKQSTTTPSYGEFRLMEGTSAAALAELNAARDEVVGQVLSRHEGTPVRIELGTPEGLDVTVVINGSKATRSVPATTLGVEMISNLDHTLERAISDASGK